MSCAAPDSGCPVRPTRSPTTTRPRTRSRRPREPHDNGPHLSVAAVARKLGIAPSTLRTWNRRYGIGPVDHAPGTHRRYSPNDVARLELMRNALLHGATPAAAATYALITPLPDPDVTPPTPIADTTPAATTLQADRMGWTCRCLASGGRPAAWHGPQQHSTPKPSGACSTSRSPLQAHRSRGTGSCARCWEP